MKVSVEKPGSPAELVHFGIKGMQWGVRKERDTSGRKSSKPHDRIFVEQRAKRRERRVKEHTAKAKQAQREIDIIAAKPSTIFFIQNHRNVKMSELRVEKARHEKAAKDISEGRFTDRQRHVIIGASVVGGILATYGTYKLVDSGIARQALTRKTPIKANDLLSRKMSPDRIMSEVVKPINPSYGDLGTKMNCRRCTFGYEMRRRGFDVKATNTISATGQTPAGLLNAIDPKSELNTTLPGHILQVLKPGPLKDFSTGPGHGLGKDAISFGDRVITTQSGNKAKVPLSLVETSQRIFDGIGKHPEGARGELGVSWKGGGAHSMAWEIIGGKPVIFDTQTGTKYENVNEFVDVARNVKGAATTRLDNVELNSNFLRRWTHNV